jgi:hypothetical protein
MFPIASDVVDCYRGGPLEHFKRRDRGDQVLSKARKIAGELADDPIWAIRWTRLSVNK